MVISVLKTVQMAMRWMGVVVGRLLRDEKSGATLDKVTR